MSRVVVVGAGAAGISAGFWLRRAGVEVSILEEGLEIGGRCRTVEKNGFRFDVGAGALPSTYANVRRIIDALGLEHQIERRGAVIGTWHDGQVERIDRRRPWTFLTTRHLSAASKARLWRLGFDLARMYRSINPYDLSTAARFDTRTVREWCDRYANEELRERFVACLCRALFLVDPEQTSIVDLFSAAKSLLVAGHLLTHPDGAGFFLERAARDLDVSLGVRVRSVAKDGAGVVVRADGPDGPREYRADGCVVAVPATRVVDLLPDLDDVRRRYLETLESSTAIVVQLGVARAPDERSSMVLIPRTVDPDLPVIGLGHNLAPSRAPNGAGVLTAFYMSDWSAAHWDDPDDTLVRETEERINRLLPGWADEVRATHVTRWRPALVASRPGTYRDLVAFQQRSDPAVRVQLAGDYLAQSSVNAAVASGERAAERLIAILSH
jgi:oxygen-dependent protoporphyrinogen oxidase